MIGWFKDGDVGTAETLNRPLRDHVADPSAHPHLLDALHRHISDPDAHDFRRTLTEYMNEHNADPEAHFDSMFYRAARMLAERHVADLNAHPQLRERYRQSVQEAYEAHVNDDLAHKEASFAIGAIIISDTPPESAVNGTLWLKPQRNRYSGVIEGGYVYVYYNEWRPLFRVGVYEEKWLTPARVSTMDPLPCGSGEPFDEKHFNDAFTCKEVCINIRIDIT